MKMKLFLSRDCNGESNGRALEEAAIIAENEAAANGDSRGLALLNIPAGNVYYQKPFTIQFEFTIQMGIRRRIYATDLVKAIISQIAQF